MRARSMKALANLAVVSGLATTTAQAADADNAWSAFSLKSNPSGPWS